MNSRTPTAPEAWYGHLCTNFIGCIACRLDEREIIDPNESWVAFHHNSDIGSRKPGCHFHAMGLCHGHHQGMPGFNLPVSIKSNGCLRKCTGLMNTYAARTGNELLS